MLLPVSCCVKWTSAPIRHSEGAKATEESAFLLSLCAGCAGKADSSHARNDVLERCHAEQNNRHGSALSDRKTGIGPNFGGLKGQNDAVARNAAFHQNFCDGVGRTV